MIVRIMHEKSMPLMYHYGELCDVRLTCESLKMLVLASPRPSLFCGASILILAHYLSVVGI